MMKKVDFILYFEHWQRELYGILFIKRELERRGFSVEVSGLSWHKEYSLTTYRYLPEVVVFPWIYNDFNVKMALWFPKRIEKIVNMQCEQIYSDYSKDSGWNRTREEALKAWHVSWGPKSTERYLEWGVSEDHIFQTGSVNLDLLNDSNAKLILDKEALAALYGLDPSKKWIIFCSSFTLNQVSEKEIRAMQESLSPEVADMRESMILSKNAILEWIEAWLDKNSDSIFIYRPHPGERDDPRLENLSKKSSRFFYFSELTAAHWIHACDYVLSWISTSMVDAHFSDKPFALIRPVPVPPRLEIEIFRGADIITTYEGFQKFIDSGAGQTVIQENDFEMFFSNIRNKDAHICLCDSLEELYHANIEAGFSEHVRTEKLLRKQNPLKILFVLVFWVAERVDISPLMFFHKRWRKILWNTRQNRKQIRRILEDMEC